MATELKTFADLEVQMVRMRAAATLVNSYITDKIDELRQMNSIDRKDADAIEFACQQIDDLADTLAEDFRWFESSMGHQVTTTGGRDTTAPTLAARRHEFRLRHQRMRVVGETHAAPAFWFSRGGMGE